MAEYTLSYTASEIDERLGLVGENKENINAINESINTINGGIETINTELENKANVEHTHDYAETNHTHDNYADVNHEHDYADVNHVHDNYAEKEHNHDDKYEAIGTAETMLGESKDYTDTVASGKADLVHNHDEMYDEFGSADAMLSESKTYTDNAVKAVKDDLLNGAGSAYDTLKELGDLIDENHDALEALEEVATSKADKDHTHPGQESFSKDEPSGQVTGDYWMESY